MKIYQMSNMKGGWFVGEFNPTAFKSSFFEVCYKKHPKGEKWPDHYHKTAVEINYLIRGKMKMHDTILIAGDIFVLEQYEVANPVFLEDCELIVVKTTSDLNDKYDAISNN